MGGRIGIIREDMSVRRVLLRWSRCCTSFGRDGGDVDGTSSMGRLKALLFVLILGCWLIAVVACWEVVVIVVR